MSLWEKYTREEMDELQEKVKTEVLIYRVFEQTIYKFPESLLREFNASKGTQSFFDKFSVYEVKQEGDD